MSRRAPARVTPLAQSRDTRRQSRDTGWHSGALDALADEIEVIWGADSAGAEARPRVVVAHAGAELRVHVSPDPPVHGRRAAPAGGLRRRIAVCYDCSQPAEVVVPDDARLVDAGDPAARELRIAPEWGSQSDWERFVDSGFPWLAATDGARVLAVCESARWSRRGAEAGVWTLPAARGRGLAAAVVGGWARMCAGRVPRVYYSTSANNVSSQRVTERLALPRIGELWYLAPDAM